MCVRISSHFNVNKIPFYEKDNPLATIHLVVYAHGTSPRLGVTGTGGTPPSLYEGVE